MFRRHFQDHIKVFHPKAQVWKSNLQTFPEPSKVGFIIYSAHMLQVHHLTKNVLKATERENKKTETAIQSEVDFQNEEDRKGFYKSYNGYDESQQIAPNHKKVPTIYRAPKYRNLLPIHLLRAFPPDPDIKYPTTGTQKRFVPDPGA